MIAAPKAPSQLQPGAAPQESDSPDHQSAESALQSSEYFSWESELRFQRWRIFCFVNPGALLQAGV
jgi:hypothetical protein